MMKKYLLIGVLLFITKGFSQDANPFFNKADAFCKENVSNGKVAYSKIHTNQDRLNELLKIAKRSNQVLFFCQPLFSAKYN